MPAPIFATLSGVTVTTARGDRLFHDLSLAFGAELTGLVGANGTGKTTLLRLLAGEIAPERGSVQRSGRVAMLRQHPPGGEVSVAAAAGLGAAFARLIRLEAGEAEAADLAAADWTLPQRFAQALDLCGMGGLDPAAPVRGLSGGEATRLALAGLLADPPDLLLLDEPTNNLDAAGRALVERLLADRRGGAVIASHDRTLLDGADRILGLAPAGARLHPGGWTAYAAAEAAEATAAAQALDLAERAMAAASRQAQAARERRALRDAAGRRGRAGGGQAKVMLDFAKGRAEASHGRGATLADRMTRQASTAEAAARSRVHHAVPVAIDLPAPDLPAGRLALRLTGLEWRTPAGRPVLAGVDLTITGPQRIALTGANGAGKSTLLRLAAGIAAPAAGRVERAVPAAYLDQAGLQLDPDLPLAEAVCARNPGATQNAAHAALARLGFRGAAGTRAAGALSGGEAMRAALACILGIDPPGLLLLDEPTNHLDLDALAALEAGLLAWRGALIVASHDAAFLAALRLHRHLTIDARGRLTEAS